MFKDYEVGDDFCKHCYDILIPLWKQLLDETSHKVQRDALSAKICEYRILNAYELYDVYCKEDADEFMRYVTQQLILWSNEAKLACVTIDKACKRCFYRF